ncbi:MAG: hypothetical protein D6816_17010 [Bacteroidetes bacterium]|nr:MAG: hypothetical protein D6816_17010 [Bacteroidota bacterium]
MSIFVPNTFVTKFGAQIIAEYQRMGAALRPFARTVRMIGQESFYFPRGGRIDAVPKAGRHADIVINNTDHDRVLCTARPYYAADAVDDVDQLMTNQSLQQFYREMIVAGLGRQEDEVQIAAMNTSNTPLTAAPGPITTSIIEEANRTLSLADVPRSGRVALISPWQTSQILAAAGNEFISSELRGTPGPQSAQEGRVVGMWRGFTFVEHTGLPQVVGTPDRTTCFFFHWPAVGKLLVRDIEVRIGEIFQKDEFMVRGKLVLGAVTIRPEAVLSFNADNA